MGTIYRIYLGGVLLYFL